MNWKIYKWNQFDSGAAKINGRLVDGEWRWTSTRVRPDTGACASNNRWIHVSTSSISPAKWLVFWSSVHVNTDQLFKPGRRLSFLSNLLVIAVLESVILRRKNKHSLNVGKNGWCRNHAAIYVETSSAQLEFFLCNRFFLVNKARTRSKHILMLKHKFHNNLAGIIFSPRKRQRVRFAQRKLFRYSTTSFQLTKKTTSPGETPSLWSFCGKRRNSNRVSVESTVGFRTPTTTR